MYTFLSADDAAIAETGLVHKYSLAEDREAPLFVLVHGRAGDANVMSAFKSCVPPGCSVLLPQAPSPDVKGGFSWWTVFEDAGYKERAAAGAERLSVFVEAAKNRYGLHPRFTAAFGFSQGAALLSVAVQRSPAALKGAALLAGFVVETGDSPAGRPLPAIFIANGTLDDVVSIDSARRGEKYLRGNGYAVEYIEDPVRHKVGSEGMRALKAWAARLAEG